jgi:ABC1 atypical kinase-like domain
MNPSIALKLLFPAIVTGFSGVKKLYQKPGLSANTFPLYATTRESLDIDEILEATRAAEQAVKRVQEKIDLEKRFDDEDEFAAELAVQALVDDTCEVNEDGGVVDEVCADEVQRAGLRSRLKSLIGKTAKLIRKGEQDDDLLGEDGELPSEGERLERGWEERGNSSALRRNAEVWKFAFQAVFRCLKPRKLKKKGANEQEIEASQIDAAVFIRDGLLKLGPSFVKLGQVAATRTDVLPKTFIDVLKTLQDEVPGFSGKRAKEIISVELGMPVDTIFQDFSETPLKAASLGQVHTAMYNGKKVAIKVQRAGLKELFDCDLKNLKKLAEILDKFDPKTDGADRDWVTIYEESERLLYQEIDYLNEAQNAERFSDDFQDIEWVRVPKIYREVSSPRVLTMEFIESFKLTDIERIEKLGLDKGLLAQRTADAFLRQIVETSVRSVKVLDKGYIARLTKINLTNQITWFPSFSIAIHTQETSALIQTET